MRETRNKKVRRPMDEPPAGLRSRPDSADAFLPDPTAGGVGEVSDDLAEVLGEDFVWSATSGSDVDDEVLAQVVPEELGGPFIETGAGQEIGTDEDASNPPGAEAEPLPRAVHGIVERPPEDE